MPDRNELIIGDDWMAKQEMLAWDYANNQVRSGDGNEWIALHRDIHAGCRRVLLETSIVLRPRQETETPVRVTRESRRSVPREGVTEAVKVTNLSHVYSGASVLPAQFTQLRVRVVNGDTRQQVLRIGTRLDKLERAEIVERNSEPLSKDPLTPTST